MSTAQQPSFDNVKATQMTGIFSHSEDKYDGVIINSNDLPGTVEEFVTTLNSSIAYWRSTKRRGIWLRIPIEKSEFIPLAVSAGFVFHHAEKHYLMLNHWLSEEENRMPANASHQVGVGCVVINNGKILAVQERTGPLRGTGIWKMPTGLSDAGEDLCDTAIREVQEETGIETEFVSVLCIRQSHTALFGKSDLFFICLLRPKTTLIQMQLAEIAACEWIDADQFLSQKFFMSSPIFSVVNQRIRETVAAVAADPTWCITPSADANAADSTDSGLDDHASGGTTYSTAVTKAASADVSGGTSGSTVATKAAPPAAAVAPPILSFAASKLPNGVRPGESVLYHIIN